MTRYRIEGEFQVQEFDGDLIAGPVSTRPHPVTGKLRARWTELAIYRPDSGGYVLHKVNQSRVWHLVSGEAHVRTPGKVWAEDLPSDAVYCAVLPARNGRAQCPLPEPGWDLAPDTLVLTEQPQYAVFRCIDEQEVRARLTEAFRRVNIGAEADPVRRLLAEAARNDPAFASGTKPVVAI